MTLDVRFSLERPGGFSLDAGFSAPGQGVTALFGGSGSGKTTVLRAIAGLLDGVAEVRGAMKVADESLERVYMSGLEAVPWRCRNQWDDECSSSCHRFSS